MINFNIIKRPIITEKSINEAKTGKYTFEVFKDVNKQQIKKAVEEKYKVNVLGVTTRIVKGRKKRVGVKRQEIKESSFKKATVTLKKEQKIDFFEGSGK